LEGGLHHKSNLCFLCADTLPSYTSLLTNKLCTNRSFVCQTLAWLREPACSGVGLTIDITSSQCASWHGSSLILCAACSASGQRSKREHSKAPASLLKNLGVFGPRKASKVEKPSSRGVSQIASLVPNASTSSLAHTLVRSLHTCMCVYYSVSTQLWVRHTAAPSRSWDP